MLNLILAESEIELISEEIQSHSFIKNMAKLEDYERRERPDIAHLSLLYLLDSPLNRRNLLNVFES